MVVANVAPRKDAQSTGTDRWREEPLPVERESGNEGSWLFLTQGEKRLDSSVIALTLL